MWSMESLKYQGGSTIVVVSYANTLNDFSLAELVTYQLT